MNTDEAPVTTDEFKAAYKRAGFWRFGISFDRAMSIKNVRSALENACKARRQRHQLPIQPSLI